MSPRLLLDRLIDGAWYVRRLHLTQGDQASMPAEVCFLWTCIQRLAKAVHTFSTDKVLQHQAAVLWSAYRHSSPCS